jgi:hypothetical protein
MPDLIQKQPSLSSLPGLVAMAVGVLAATFVLSQFDATRKIMGLAQKGQLPTVGS